MTLPTFSAIADFFKSLAGILTSITAIVTAILLFFEKTRKFLVGIWHSVSRLFTDMSSHRVDLKIVPDHQRCQWQEGSAEFGKEAMLVYCNLFLTNVAPALPFQILDAYIRRPFVRANLKQLHPSQVSALGGARLASVFTARFTIAPPVCESKEVFEADVILVDQYGGKHKAKNVKFEPMGGPAWEMMRKQREHEKQTWEQIRKAQEESKKPS
jgi:hypothetical protein